MSWFVRQSIKRGRLCSFNLNYKSKICDHILKTIPEESNVKGKIHDTIEAYLDDKNKQSEKFKIEFESNFNNHRYIDEEQKKKLSMEN